jgi:hypothetical protein
VSGFQWQHCQNPDACTAAKPTTHCRRCVIMSVSKSPEAEARRIAGIRAKHADPEFRAAHAKRLAESVAKASKDPAFIERRREHGRRQYENCLSRSDVRARNAAPEVRKAASRKTSAKRLAWCPEDLREHYLYLLYTQHIRAAEARVMIEEMIEARSPEAAARREVARITAELVAKEARRKAQAY